jgi:hypothetical protein
MLLYIIRLRVLFSTFMLELTYVNFLLLRVILLRGILCVEIYDIYAILLLAMLNVFVI